MKNGQSSLGVSSHPVRTLLILFSLTLWGLLGSCTDTVRSGDDCQAPKPSSSDTLHGRYTWTDNTGSVVTTITQLSSFQFRIATPGNLPRFTLRVDRTVLNPARTFNDLTATYRLLRDTLYIDSVVFQGNGRSGNVPFGTFLFFCTQDSFLFLGGSDPGVNSADTVMRISIRR